MVHNRYVVNSLCQSGVVFIEEISEVPDGSILIFLAHGVSQAVRAEVRTRNLTMLYDATCPLVTKVHMAVARASRVGMEAILIGHADHPEVQGTMGQYSNLQGGIYLVESLEDVWQLQVKDKNNLCFMTQTTLSVSDTLDMIDALRQRFPSIIGSRKDDICYATTNRQEAVCNLIDDVDIILVVGSQNSSNSNRLAELAKRAGKPAYLIDSAVDIKESWFNKVYNIGVTAGASAPALLVDEVIIHLKALGGTVVREISGRKENIVFTIPKELCIDIQ